MEILALSIFAAIGLGGFLLIYAMADRRYPKVAIDVYDRGIKQRITYRLLGQTIIHNNLMQILMNQFIICGNINELEFDATPGGFGKWTRVYRAVRRHDYLFGLIKNKNSAVRGKDGNMLEIPLTKTPPIIKVYDSDGTENHNIRAEWSDDGLLLPLDIMKTNEFLKEKEITNGKTICSRFIEMYKSNKEFTDASNPIIATLITTLPLFIIVVAFGIIIYMALGQTIELVEAAKGL